MVETLLKKESALDKLHINIGGFAIFSYGSVALFLLTVTAYGLVALANHNLQAQEPQLEEEIQQKVTGLKKDLHDLLISDSRLQELKNLISKHRFSSSIFLFFEKTTLPQVQFSNFNLNGSTLRVDLAGETTNFNTLAQQITILENSPEVESIEFGGLSITAKNRIGFSLNVIFKPSLINLPPQPTQ